MSSNDVLGAPASGQDYRPRDSAYYENSVPAQVAAGGNNTPAAAARINQPLAVPVAARTQLHAQRRAPQPAPRTRNVRYPVAQPQQQQQIPGVGQPTQHVKFQFAPAALQYNEPQQQPRPTTSAQGAGAAPAAKIAETLQLKVAVSASVCTVWQGILEISSRAAAMVFAFLLLALSAAVIGTIDSNNFLSALNSLDDSIDAGTGILSDVQELINGSKGVCGFLIFVALVVFIEEIPTIVARFTLDRNTGLLKILHVVDIVASVVMGICFLSGGAASASLASQWNNPPLLCSGTSDPCDAKLLGPLTGAVAFLGFAGLAIMAFLTVWAIVSIVTKWDDAKNKKQNTEGV